MSAKEVPPLNPLPQQSSQLGLDREVYPAARGPPIQLNHVATPPAQK